MVYQHLNDTNTYQKTDSACDNRVMNKIRKLTQKYNILSKDKVESLTNFCASNSNFYGLPKFHKSSIISEVIVELNNEYVTILEPNDLKLRPIAAGSNSPTRPLSELLDKILKPFIVHEKNYVRDNTDLLEHCSRINKRNTILATFELQ